jgi:hypothetical protein
MSPSRISDTPIGAPRDFKTRTTAGANGPLGEVERRPRPRPFKAAGLVDRARLPLRVSRGSGVAKLGVVTGLATVSPCNIWDSSDSKRSIRSWISAAFLNEAEDNFTGRNYASLFYLQEKFG